DPEVLHQLHQLHKLQTAPARARPASYNNTPSYDDRVRRQNPSSRSRVVLDDASRREPRSIALGIESVNKIGLAKISGAGILQRLSSLASHLLREVERPARRNEPIDPRTPFSLPFSLPSTTEARHHASSIATELALV